jgi:arylsulfatase A-like enzyme
LHAGKAFRGKSPRGLYGDVVEEIDWSVGQVLAALRDEDLAESTLVVFTSDNGPWLIKQLEGGSAGLLREGKGSTWEGGVRVPCLA